MSSPKPIVHYLPSDDLPFIGVGLPAWVYPLDHPDSEHISNTKLVRTSLVVSYDRATGNFETENSCYVRAKTVAEKLAEQAKAEAANSGSPEFQ